MELVHSIIGLGKNLSMNVIATKASKARKRRASCAT